MKSMALLVALLMCGCTDNAWVKHYGGSQTIDLPCDRALTNVTWKGDSLWYLTVPLEGEPREHVFQEKSSFGAVEGGIVLQESRCRN